MKTKSLLFAAVVAAMLLTMLALPAMADEDTAMWVSRVRLAWNGRSSSSPDRVVGMVHVRDANLAAVDGALVTAEWTLPNGTQVVATALTDFQGIATIETWAGGGSYTLCVTDVAKAGWVYAPDLNLETCGALLVKWPFHPKN
ncbi:MAG TPA: hypothetical protein PKO09_00515 [Anaerolineae bacterium]|nr:hypothetical protein [Anaerolineae bacterium]